MSADGNNEGPSRRAWSARFAWASTPEARVRLALARVAATGRRHWLFLVLIAAGAALRGITLAAYRPALFGADSRFYLKAMAHLEPTGKRPIGYPALLRVLPVDTHVAVVPLVQHLMGLLMAVLVYAVLLRLGVRRWLAALATAPVLLDAYQLNIEQYVLSETLFELLLAAGCVALLWQRRPGFASAAFAGLLLAAATLTRGIGLFVFVPALLTVLFLRPRLSRTIAFGSCFVLPIVGYVLWFHSVNGAYSLTGYEGRFLYGRVVRFVDCADLSVPSYERELCPRQPVGKRPWAYKLVWSRKVSPVYGVEPPPGKTRNDVAGDFAQRVILQQPLTYIRVVSSDYIRSFAPTKTERRREFRVSQWQFQVAFPIPDQSPVWSVRSPVRLAYRNQNGHVKRGLASFLRTYQRFGYTPGPLLAACLIAALLGAVGIGRARQSGLRSAAFLFLSAALVVSLGAVAVSLFSWRYLLPELVLLPPAAAVGITALTMRREDGNQATESSASVARRRDAPAPESEPEGEAVR
jgi:hypothetical protein